jgi:hypothetical protein
MPAVGKRRLQIGDPPYPLTQSRISLGAERRLFHVVARNMLEGVKALDLPDNLYADTRTWQEKVLPYHCASGLKRGAIRPEAVLTAVDKKL